MDTAGSRDVTKAARGSALSFVGAAAGRGAWFLCQAIIARSFGPGIFGLYMLAVTVLKIADLMCRFGLHLGTMRFIALYRYDDPARVKGLLLSSTTISLVSGTIVGGCIYFSSGLVANAIFHKPELASFIRMFSFAVPFMAAMMVVATASQGFHTTRYAVLVRDIVQPSISLLLVLILTFSGTGIMGLVLAFDVSYALALGVGIFLLTRLFPGLRDKSLRPQYEIGTLLAYSAPLFFTNFLQFLISWTDTLMLGVLKTSQDVGIFKAATQVPLLLPVVLGASNSIYGPMIASLFHQGETERMDRLFKMTTRWVYTLALPAVIVIIASAPDIMFIFGHDFVGPGASVLILLTLAQFVNCMTGGVAFNLAMTGRQKIEFINSLGMVVVNVIMNYLLIPRYGILGAGLATASSVISINVLRIVEVYFLCNMQPYTLSYLKALIPATVSLGWVILTAGWNMHPLWSVIANTLGVGLIFCGYIAFSGLDEEERYLWSLLKKRSGMLKSSISL